MSDGTLDRPPAGVRDAVVREGRRRRARLGAALVGTPAALAVAAVAAASPLSGPDRLVPAAPAPSTSAPTPAPGPTASPPPAAPCPNTLVTEPGDLSVPGPPGDDLRDALVLAEPPLAVTTCRYGDARLQGYGQSSAPPDEVQLEGSAVLRGGFERMPGDLAVPAGAEFGACTLVGGAVIPYLVQVQYADRTVWLRTAKEANACELITNGAFTSATYFGDQIAASHDAGAWVPDPPRGNAPEEASPCPYEAVGRAGQERVLVSDGWDRIVVCVSQDRQQTARDLDQGQAREVADLLNALPSIPAAGYSASCDPAPPDERDALPHVRLVISYPAGRTVQIVLFFSCDPPVSNGSRAAEATPEQQAELLRLLRD